MMQTVFFSDVNNIAFLWLNSHHVIKKNMEKCVNGTIEVLTTNEKNVEVNEHSDFLSSKKADGDFRQSLSENKLLRHRYLHTACVCFSKLVLGWRLGITGPTLPDLRLLMNENLARASWILSALAFGGLSGSLTMGAIYDKFNKRLTFMALILSLSVFTAVTPWCSSFVSMVAIHALTGICIDGTNTVIAADIALVWRNKRASVLQAVNFAFSIGAIISPLTSGPFLAIRQLQTSNIIPLVNDSTTQSSSSQPMMTDSTDDDDRNVFKNSTTNVQDSEILVYAETRVHWAYTIAAAVSCLAFLCIVADYFLLLNVYDYDGNSRRDTYDMKPLKYPLSHNWKIMFVALLSFMFWLYLTGERLLYNYLVTFLTERLFWSKSQASWATTMFWVAFAGGRMLSVIVARVLNLTAIFALCLGLVLAASFILLFVLWFNVNALVWVACVFYGMGLSAISGNIFAWVSAKVCPLTGKVSSVLYTVALTGTIVFPLITGNIMSKVSYDWFIYIEIMFTCSMIVLIAFTEITYNRLLTK